MDPVNFAVTDNVMTGSVGGYVLGLKTRNVLTATPVATVCTATGPGVYTITAIDTFTIFPMALTTASITITGAGTLT
jgi:hypothetical protein